MAALPSKPQASAQAAPRRRAKSAAKRISLIRASFRLSERNLVVEIGALEAAGAFPCPGHRRAFGPVAATVAAAAVEHHQFAPELLEHDLGRIFLRPVLVGVFAGLELALEINLGALFQILLGHLGEVFIEDDDPVPFGLFLAL